MSRASHLIVSGICLVVLNSAFLCAAEPTSLTFRGVQPGVTTEKELLADKEWSQPTSRDLRADGSAWLEYRLRAYPNVGVLIHDGKVQSIDVTMPGRLTVAAVASAYKLGKPAEDETLPPSAITGPPLPEDANRILYPDRRVLLLVDSESGHVQRMRMFSELVDRRTVGKAVLPHAAPPLDDQPAHSALKGENAKTRQIVKAVATMIARDHLSKHPIDDEIAHRTVDSFIDTLDPAKMYFTQDDVSTLTRRFDLVDDQLRDGNLTQHYEIFNKYHERVRERVALAAELIDADHDFTVDESLITDASKLTFPENELEVREIWRKRVKYDLLVHKAAGADMDEARRRVRQKYSGYLLSVNRVDDLDLTEMALNSLAASYDPHSRYFSEKTVEDFRIGVAAEIEGIGAQLKMIDGYATITSVVPESPAAKDGRLQPDDRIIAIGEADGESMVDAINKPLRDIVELIRGKQGTAVRLRVLPKGKFESAVYDITRGKVEVQSIGHAVLSGDSLPEGRSGKVGYIYLPTFYLDMEAQRAGDQNYRSTTRDMQRILSDFDKQEVNVVIIDLMSNGGGSLTEAINLLGLFLDNDPAVVQVKGQDGKVQVFAALDYEKVWDGPLVVLTNRQSAGGSEILAGAIQDYQRGLIVGDSKTHGLGTVATARDIGPILFKTPNPPNLGALKLVLQKFYRPNGESTQLRGVAPDVVLPSLTEHMETGEALFPYALQFDAIAAASYKKSEDFPVDDKLRKSLFERSESRRAVSAYFADLTFRIAKYNSAKDAAIPLSEEAYLARQDSSSDSTDDAPTITGIPNRTLNGYTNEALAVALDYASRMHHLRAQKAYTAKQFAAAMEGYQKSVAADPEYAGGHFKYAWALSTCPDSRYRNGPLAVTHATRACELSDWKTWQYLLTLSVAEAEAGDFDKALTHLKSALDMAPQQDRETYSYLEERFRRRRTYSSR